MTPLNRRFSDRHDHPSHSPGQIGPVHTRLGTFWQGSQRRKRAGSCGIKKIWFIAEPGSTLTALHGRAAEALAPYRRDERSTARLVAAAPPAFVFLHRPRSP